jgi:hypothetical protein
MLRVILITIAVLFALRLFARLTAPRIGQPSGSEPRQRDVGGRGPRMREPALSAAERQRLEAERELALREGRQLDAIEIHRQLTGSDRKDVRREADATGRHGPT